MDQAVEHLKTEFRRAMRGLPGGVVVVTAVDAGGRYAVTLTAAMSLTMEPPSMVIAVNRSASIFQALEKGAGFCVNLLTSGHQPVAQACSSSKDRHTRFDTGNFSMDADVPYLADSQASLFCTQTGRHLHGTHALIIGKVEKIIINEVIDPLLYLDGEYLSFKERVP